MNWSERTVNNELRIISYTINDIFFRYQKDMFYVNRRYQRKLVWGIQEKQLLIDSIFKSIPLPAILIAQYELKVDKISSILEIVDGMQRLNAIISFMLGEYSVLYEGKPCYFDPMACNGTFQLLRDSKIKAQESLLPIDICQDFCMYPLSVIITGQDDDMIELIFSRINSTGRKIASQDLRQSMSVGEFPDLVRRVASRVRHDYTYDDRVNLSDMPKISVGPKQFGYGVDIDTIFWRRHDLVNSFNIKESKDEEIIEALMASILLQDDFTKSKNNLDKLYEKNSTLNARVENRIIELGKDILENKFARVFDLIDMIFDSVESDFSSYLFDTKKVSNKDECFKILFRVLYQLFEEDFIIVDYHNVAVTIKNARSIFNEFISSPKVTYPSLEVAKENLYKIIKSSFAKSLPKVSGELERTLDRRLSYSRIELQMTEFKIGITYFDSGKVNQKCVQQIAKTLVAMANNSNAKEEGFVIVGVADSKESYEDWYDVFGTQPVIINQHYVPGITAEAHKSFNTVDKYFRSVRKLLNNEPISENLKSYVLEKFEVIDYHGVELLLLRSKNMGEVSLYGGTKYVRQSNETVRVE